MVASASSWACQPVLMMNWSAPAASQRWQREGLVGVAHDHARLPPGQRLRVTGESSASR